MENGNFAIVVSQFNPSITNGLYDGAYEFLMSKGITEDQITRFEAPGAFELPLIAKKIAETGKYEGVICLGCVIKGETAHFEYISNAASMGLMQSMLDTGIPIAFGILTTYNRQHAEARSKPGPDNKGREAAAACWETVRTLEMCVSESEVGPKR